MRQDIHALRCQQNCREEISNASAMRKGERYMKDTVHHFLTYPFTLSLEQVKEKKGICARKATAFGRGTKAMWAGATPPLVHAACPIVAWSRSIPHVREQVTIMESNMKCMMSASRADLQSGDR